MMTHPICPMRTNNRLNWTIELHGICAFPSLSLSLSNIYLMREGSFSRSTVYHFFFSPGLPFLLLQMVLQMCPWCSIFMHYRYAHLIY